jgi:HSP20 family protein
MWFKNPFAKLKIKNEESEYLFPPDQIKSIDEKWLNKEYEGELSVDVYQTEKDIIIESTIAGVKPEDLNITVNNDMITIRGKRERNLNIKDEDFLYKECYWGGFSRSIILPTNVKVEKIKASLKNGLLTIILPKINKTQTIKVKEEE